MGFNVLQSYCWILTSRFNGAHCFNMSTPGDHLIADCLCMEYIDEWYNELGRFATSAKGYR